MVIIATGKMDKMPKAKSAKTARHDPWRDIEDFLGTQSREALVGRLLDVARRDDQLYQSLMLEAARVLGGGKVVAAFRRAIANAVIIDGFVDWRESASFAGTINQVVDSLAELLEPDAAAMLVELVEYAIEQVEGVFEQVDDSGGDVGFVVERLGEMHRKACAIAKPDPLALAGRLFHLETTLPFGLCSFDPATYRGALGKTGLRHYRELAETQWRKLKPSTGDQDFDRRRSAITRIMERLAEAEGNIDELVAIKAKDLSSSYRYLVIAEILAGAKRGDEALQWAERGIGAFPNQADNRLRDFLVAAYLKRKRNDEALHLTWVQFGERPGLGTFQKLHAVASKIGVWPQQRERALLRLAEVIASEAAAPSWLKSKPPGPDYSIRLSIALWEKNLDAAWTAANQGNCERDLLITLAGKLEATRPDHAIGLYRRVVPSIVEQTGNAAYEEAIGLVRKVGRLMKAPKQSRQFGDYLSELRVQFKLKRNFIKLLDAVVRQGAG